ncbi:DUF1289 domain-containing protein [Pseudomonas putida]|uniref:DUF1289 domain-containing protein n=1 Tax=Pseudomonas putida TaxID=303 RepID=UPI00034F0E9E|nr:DUF1289 domain-containing protein [Pseudomonas putida]AGN79171.1 Fe-S protein [Pseudomonas putida H8234]QPN42767.1 DUF1289 domain-containing protein [Priestia aryabhattai]HDS1809503.1 DUF1289 domain-containing protein [Pseudomonas putida]
MLNQLINTPCVGRCSTVFGDRVCRGCHRFQQEVIDWNVYPGEVKENIWARLEAMVIAAMTTRVDVIDSALLRQQLIDRKIRFVDRHSPYCWAYSLLRSGARAIQRLEAYGVRVKAEHAQKSLPELRDDVDSEIHGRSEGVLWNMDNSQAIGGATTS